MGFFFLDLEKEYKHKGTEHWLETRMQKHESLVQGFFYEKTPNGRISIQFQADEERMFFCRDGKMKSLALCLTAMEERFSYLGSEKVYEIKLKNKNLLTHIYTTDRNTFTRFYLHLSKFCILFNFDKHFRLTKQLGSGAFSKVYNGQNIFSKEEVALKIFDKTQIEKMSDGPTIISNEITNLEKLRKYHLSPLIETYETDDCVIIVMQKAEAGNMFDYLREHEADYNEDLIRLITMRVLQNLDELHSAGFIHRDIKPENILFKNNSIKTSLFFGDFGLTVEKQQCECTQIGRMCSGTMGFIAPEVLHNKRYDEKCDLFSFGCLLYFMHKGQSLFCGKSKEQIFDMTLNDRIIERKVKSLENLTKQSKQLMLNALKVNPQERMSAHEALGHEYFNGIEHRKPSTGEDDRTMLQYISRRITHFFSC